MIKLVKPDPAKSFIYLTETATLSDTIVRMFSSIPLDPEQSIEAHARMLKYSMVNERVFLNDTSDILGCVVSFLAAGWIGKTAKAAKAATAASAVGAAAATSGFWARGAHAVWEGLKSIGPASNNIIWRGALTLIGLNSAKEFIRELETFNSLRIGLTDFDTLTDVMRDRSNGNIDEVFEVEINLHVFMMMVMLNDRYDPLPIELSTVLTEGHAYIPGDRKTRDELLAVMGMMRHKVQALCDLNIVQHFYVALNWIRNKPLKVLPLVGANVVDGHI